MRLRGDSSITPRVTLGRCLDAGDVMSGTTTTISEVPVCTQPSPRTTGIPPGWLRRGLVR
jgi:hypothetical protein